ncbi:MAG: hypothetical protein ACR2QT_00545 [Woeseiaceae bacterium]
MSYTPKKNIILVFCVALIGAFGCTSTNTIPASEEALIANKIHAGDKLTLNFRNGSVEKIKLSYFDAEQIAGIAKNDQTIIANYEQITFLQHKKPAVAKTAGLTLGVVALAVGLAAGEAAASLLAGPGGS